MKSFPARNWFLLAKAWPPRKWDGTRCLVRNGQLLKRYEVKQGGKPPVGFEAANEIDAITGKRQGWVAVGDGPEDRWHKQAFEGQPDGTYELLGPKVQGNPDHFERHVLIPHGKETVDAPRTFDALKTWLAKNDN